MHLPYLLDHGECRAKGSGLTESDKVALLSELYVHLTDQMHAALNDISPDQASGAKQQQAGAPVPGSLEHLLVLAGEYELQGMGARAEALHQRRTLAAQQDAQIWYDYGCFCMRAGEQGRAQACYDKALEMDPSHMATLHALAALLLHQGQATDPLFLEGAEAKALKAKEVAGAGANMAWALLFLAYNATGNWATGYRPSIHFISVTPY